MTTPIRVLLVDDQPLIRLGFKGLIATDPTFEVVGEAETGQQAVDFTQSTAVDVVLMDIRMPQMDGLTATRIICADERLSGVKVLILTTFENDEYVLDALRAGASGFLGKATDPAELLSAIKVIAGGESLLSPRATSSLITRFLQPTPQTTEIPSLFSDLTERELEILKLVATGLSNAEIAERLFISPLTAKTHVNRTMMKLGARDRAQLVILAYQTGLIRL